MIYLNIRSRGRVYPALIGIAICFCATRAYAQTIAITGGKVFPVSSAPIENGTVLIKDGKITDVGSNIEIPANAQIINASGKWVTPGLINSATQLGVQEIAAVPETRDVTATGRHNIAAAFTIWEGFNYNSIMLAPARKDGITTFAVMPMGGLVAGQAALLSLVKGTTSDMLVKSPIAMVAQVGNAAAAGTGARGELIAKLRELLEDALYYSLHRSEFNRSQTREFSASRADLEAMVPVINGTLPLLVFADHAPDIDAAMRLAQQYKLKLIIGGGAEAWMLAGKLAAESVPVLTGAMNNIPVSFATLGQRQDNAALLRKAGVQVVIIGNAGNGDEETMNVRNIKYEAGNAVAYGMKWDEALRAITLTPAEVFGVADKMGSLQAGRVANVVIWDGDPFEFKTRAEHVFVRGREYSEKTREELLTERYRSLPPQE